MGEPLTRPSSPPVMASALPPLMSMPHSKTMSATKATTVMSMIHFVLSRI
jgi:hypothetical protein